MADEIDLILSMSEDDLRAEMRGEGLDPDQVIADMRARLEAARAACESFAESEGRLLAEINRLKVDASNHAADAATVRQERDRAEAENARLRIALHDAIRRPMGVTPDSAVEFYSPRMADKAEARRQRMGGADGR